jgi:DNA repair protein RadC
MNEKNFNIKTTDQQNQYLPNFVQEFNGDYVIDKPLSKNEILDLAKSVIASQFQRGKTMKNASACKDYFLLDLAKYEHEVFCALFLDNKNRIIAFEHLFNGTINKSPVFPREIIKKALQHNAAAVIFAHNHPSGVAEISKEDIATTKQLKETLAIIDVRVLDHIITAGGQAVSLGEENLI